MDDQQVQQFKVITLTKYISIKQIQSMFDAVKLKSFVMLNLSNFFFTILLIFSYSFITTHHIQSRPITNP